MDARAESYHASFSDECMACGICVDHCLFNALTKGLKEGEA
ncbi:4Fe-4S binding protein [Desulfosalsimonas sp.]